MRRIVPTLAFLIAMFALPAGASALPPVGGLTQPGGTDGCINFSGTDGCGSSPTVTAPLSVVTSPDGKNVYVSDLDSNVTTFTRGANGTLTQTSCINETGTNGCGTAAALGNNYEVDISPDGANVYVTVNDKRAIVWLSRNATTGALSYSGCLGAAAGTSGCPNISGAVFNEPQSVAISPDGNNVYAITSNTGELLSFNRAANGSLNSTPGCFRTGGGGGCTNAEGIAAGDDVVVSPDGANVYTASGVGSVGVFSRAAGGTLTQPGGTAGCIANSGSPCTSGHAISDVRRLAASPDGKTIYATSFGDDAVAILNRGAGGTLSQAAAPGGCVNATGAGCAVATGLADAESIAASSDNKTIYVGTGYNAGLSPNSTVILSRDSNGNLSQLPLPDGCFTETGGSCSVGRELDDVQGLTVSPDGLNVYAVAFSSNALDTFIRQLAPICTDAPFQTFRNDLGGDVPLPCSDPNGNPITRSVSTPPAHGTVIVNNASGRGSYAPTSHYYGSDSFTFVATDGGATSDPATAQIKLTDRIAPFVTLGRNRLKLNRAGKVAVKVGCPKGEQDGCPNGKLTIGSSKRINITLHKKRKAKLSLGSAKFSLKAGQNKKVRVKLTRTARRVVRHLRDVRVNLKATVRDPNGNTGKTTQATHVKR